MTRARAVAAALELLMLIASAAHAVTLADPVHFDVKRTWRAEDLGVTMPLGGLGFSADRTALYAVGAADDPSSRLRRIPVTRNSTTGEIIALGTSSLVFNGGDPDPAEPSGLDAGLVFGPSNTFFYTYFPANYLAERPGGVGGNETTFSLTPRGVEGSVGGLVFSPFRTDPGTGFGRLQASSGDGLIYELPLAAAGGGLYTPGTASLFVVLPQGGTAGIDYVLGDGSYAGSLFYASYNFGELRRLTIDPGTGLPFDRVTQLPTKGTTRPVDALFASDFVAPPLGVVFDDVSGDDLFVSTSDFTNSDNNTIIQIGGFAATFPIPTTTTSTSTTTTVDPRRTTTTRLITTTTTSTSIRTTTSSTSTTSSTRPSSTTTSSATTTSTTRSTTTTSTSTTRSTTTTSTSTSTTRLPTTSTSTTTSTTRTTQSSTTSTSTTTSSTTTRPPTTTSTTSSTTTTRPPTTTSTTSSTTSTRPPTTTSTTSASTTTTTRPPTTSTTSSTTTSTTTPTTHAPTTSTSTMTSSTTTTRPSTTPTTSSTIASEPPTTSTTTTTSSTATSTSTPVTPTSSTSSTSATVTTTAPTTTTLPSGATCIEPACDDGDACTDDACTPESGCAHTPVVGLDMVTCLCRQPVSVACVGEVLPNAVDKRLAQACALFQAADGASERRAARRLQAGIKVAGKARRAAARAGRTGKISLECAAAEVVRLRELAKRARRLIAEQ